MVGASDPLNNPTILLQPSFDVSAALQHARSASLDEAIHHLLLSGLIEIDRQLVAVDMDDAPIAEFLVKHAQADGEPGALNRTRRNQRAVDGDGLPGPWI